MSLFYLYSYPIEEQVTAVEHHTFYDLSGNQHLFEVYPVGSTFYNVGGVYMFTKRNSDGTHTVLYIGENVCLGAYPCFV